MCEKIVLVADAYTRHHVPPSVVEDRRGEAICRALSETDPVRQLWAIRDGVRFGARKWARESEYVGDYGLPDDDVLSDEEREYIAVLDTAEDPLEARVREAYSDEDEAEAAVKALAGGGGYDEEHENMLREAEEMEAYRKHIPCYMEPEYEVDYDKVRGLVAGWNPGWIDDNTHVRDLLASDGGYMPIARLIIRRALSSDLTPAEAAIFVNGAARKLVSGVSRAGYKYAILRYQCGDLMALCEAHEQTYLPGDVYKHEYGRGIIPGNVEVMYPNPGACSGFGIEDDDVWFYLFPDRGSDERYELPRGSAGTIHEFIEEIDERVPPTCVDFSWEEGYTGWKWWDVREVRQEEARLAIGLVYTEDGEPRLARPAGWKRMRKIVGELFWEDMDKWSYLKKNRTALNKAGLMYKKGIGVMPKNAVKVDKLSTEGVLSGNEFFKFSEGHLTLAIGKDKADKLREVASKLDLDVNIYPLPSAG